MRVDNISLKAVSVASNLYFDSTGELNLNDTVLLPDNAIVPFNAFLGYLSDGTPVAPLTNTIVSTSTQTGWYKVWGGVAFPSDGAYVISNVSLRAGTYRFWMNRTRNTGLGKFDLYIDGVKITSTPLDFYGTEAYNIEWAIDDVEISKSGSHEIKLLANGKNASSSGYGIGGSYIMFYKTA